MNTQLNNGQKVGDFEILIPKWEVFIKPLPSRLKEAERLSEPGVMDVSKQLPDTTGLIGI